MSLLKSFRISCHNPESDPTSATKDTLKVPETVAPADGQEEEEEEEEEKE